MKIRNARNTARTIAATGQTVEGGDTVDVDDELGRALLDQPDNWAAVKPEARKATKTVGGYPSSGKPAAELAPPPAGPAPGARRIRASESKED